MGGVRRSRWGVFSPTGGVVQRTVGGIHSLLKGCVIARLRKQSWQPRLFYAQPERLNFFNMYYKDLDSHASLGMTQTFGLCGTLCVKSLNIKIKK